LSDFAGHRYHKANKLYGYVLTVAKINDTTLYTVSGKKTAPLNKML